jgi:hypothetical protein
VGELSPTEALLVKRYRETAPASWWLPTRDDEDFLVACRHLGLEPEAFHNRVLLAQLKGS